MGRLRRKVRPVISNQRDHHQIVQHADRQTGPRTGLAVGNSLAPELIAFWFKRFDLPTVLKALDLLGSRYGRLFHFGYVYEGNMYTLFIRHERGMKHSIYYEEAAKELFGKLGLKPEISKTDSQVTIVIPAEEHLVHSSP